MSTVKEQRDVGLMIHRILQWVATISSGFIVTLIVSSMDDWSDLKENAIRMEDVPEKVDKILDTVNDIDKTVDRHGYRIEQLEKTKHR